MAVTLDNKITNNLVDQGKLPENQRENIPQVTDEGKAAAGRIKAARQARNAAMEPTVSATNLAEPVTPVTVPQPQVETIPAGPLNVARNVSRNAQGFIKAQTAERDRLNELQDTFGALSDQGSLSDFFTQQREQFGATPANLQELQDIQLRLNDMDTESGVTQTRIEGAAGQTLGQAGREVTQEQRENAVRTAGLAARAAVIQGNIDTATQLAKDAVNIEYQQRTLTANNLLQQIDMVQGQVDDQTAQLLEQEKRTYEAELATIQEVKDNVANAMVNGATQAEIAQLTSDQLGDAEKIALAQSITARGAGEMRDLGIEQTQASIRSSNASAARAETGRLLDLAEAGDPAAIARLGLTMPGDTLPTSDEIAYARQYAATGKVPSGLSSAGVSFGDIAELAADLPKPEGAIVDINTNVASDKLSATDQTAFDALYNAINTDLPRIQEAWNTMNEGTSFTETSEKLAAGGEATELSFGTGLLGGIQSQINPTQAMTAYETAVADFTAKLVLARSGAAATDAEVARYQALLPGTFNTPLGIGTPGQQKLTALQTQMDSALKDKLSTQGLAIYGFSDVETPDGTFKTGEIISNEYGQTGRVNPDGSITVINQ